MILHRSWFRFTSRHCFSYHSLFSIVSTKQGTNWWFSCVRIEIFLHYFMKSFILKISFRSLALNSSNITHNWISMVVVILLWISLWTLLYLWLYWSTDDIQIIYIQSIVGFPYCMPTYSISKLPLKDGEIYNSFKKKPLIIRVLFLIFYSTY